MKVWAAVLGVILTSLTVDAKVFRNAYVAFELPDTWKCVLEHTEWVCRSESTAESKEAIIILTAKEAGPTDSFEAYTQHLNTPQSPQGGRSGPSRIVAPAKQVKISDQIWMDGLHMGSEVPNYFTRYLATIKEKIAILVTFSAHKDHYTKYSSDFFKAVQSLRVIASPSLISNSGGGPVIPGMGERNGTDAGAPIAAAPPAPEGGANSKAQKTKMMFMAIAIGLAGIALYVFMKMKQ